MRVPIRRAARAAYAPLIGLLLLAPAAVGAQEPTDTPSLRGSVSGGLAAAPPSYRLAALEIAAEVNPGRLITARLLVGSRRFCFSPDLDPGCGDRAGYGALLAGLQFANPRDVVETYTGVQVGYFRYDHPAGARNGLLAVPQAGLRRRFGSRGGAYGDVSLHLTMRDIMPIAGAGLYFKLPSAARPGS